MKVLEIAPFGNPSIYKQLVDNSTIDWVCLDISTAFIGNGAENPNFILCENSYQYPFDDNTFDIILSDQVIAHVELFWVWMAELKRISKTNGIIITIGSLSYPACPSPVDCWRIYPDGMKALNTHLDLETILSTYESLEFEHFGYSKKLNTIPNFRVPSESIASSNTLNPKMHFENKVKIFINQIIRWIPYLKRYMNPIRIAYDTITIARKK